MFSAAGDPRCSVWLPSGVPSFVCSTGCRPSLGSVVDGALCVSSMGAKRWSDRCRLSRRNSSLPLFVRTIAAAWSQRLWGGDLSRAHSQLSPWLSPWSLPGGLEYRCVQCTPVECQSQRITGWGGGAVVPFGFPWGLEGFAGPTHVVPVSSPGPHLSRGSSSSRPHLSLASVSVLHSHVLHDLLCGRAPCLWVCICRVVDVDLRARISFAGEPCCRNLTCVHMDLFCLREPPRAWTKEQRLWGWPDSFAGGYPRANSEHSGALVFLPRPATVDLQHTGGRPDTSAGGSPRANLQRSRALVFLPRSAAVGGGQAPWRCSPTASQTNLWKQHWPTPVLRRSGRRWLSESGWRWQPTRRLQEKHEQRQRRRWCRRLSWSRRVRCVRCRRCQRCLLCMDPAAARSRDLAAGAAGTSSRAEVVPRVTG